MKRNSKTTKKSRRTRGIVNAGVGVKCNGKHAIQGRLCRHMAYFTYTTGSGFMPNEFVAACGGLLVQRTAGGERNGL